MQKIIIFIIGLLAEVLGFQAVAQDKVVNTSGSDNMQNSLLWRISADHLKSPSYLFGTIHAICAEDYFFTDKMQKALEESHQLILEVNLDDPSLTSEYQQMMQLPEGVTLRDYFSDESDYQNFGSKLKLQTGISIDEFSKYKPFILISALALKGFSCPNTSSYEMKLIESARKRKMHISGLESVTSQMKIFDRMSKEDLRMMILESLKDDHSTIEKEHEMVNLYKDQDIEGLSKLINESVEFKGHEEEFLTGRNKTWVEKLPLKMQEGSCFIAVGAGHLSGESGLIRLLTEAGYKVEAVRD